MSIRTALLSTYENYREDGDESVEEVLKQNKARDKRLERFPFAVMLEAAVPEVDYANRWCWQQFGPPCGDRQNLLGGHGECWDSSSEYPQCTVELPHCHEGTWTNHFFVKTDYDFGFNEWYFSTRSEQEDFLQFVPSICWGENFPK